MVNVYSISQEDGFTRIELQKAVNLLQFKLIIDELVEKYPYERRLLDVSRVILNLSTNEVEEIAEYGNGKFVMPNKAAIYAADDLSFGIMRQLQVFREAIDTSEMDVFRSKDEAVRWLIS